MGKTFAKVCIFLVPILFVVGVIRVVMGGYQGSTAFLPDVNVVMGKFAEFPNFQQEINDLLVKTLPIKEQLTAATGKALASGNFFDYLATIGPAFYMAVLYLGAFGIFLSIPIRSLFWAFTALFDFDVVDPNEIPVEEEEISSSVTSTSSAILLLRYFNAWAVSGGLA